MDLSSTAEGVSSCPHEGLLSAIESADINQALELLNGDATFAQTELDKALISACQRGHKYLVCELVQNGANIQTKDTNDNTPVMICARNGFIDMARFFIRKKADINATNIFGDNVLILSLRPVGSVEIVKLLLQQTGVDINHQNRDGYTALMKAVEAMDVDVIKLLLDEQNNAEVALNATKNNRGETAQHIADKLGLGNVVRLLSKHKNQPEKLIQAAVDAGDLGSVHIFIDCKFSYKYTKETTINGAFQDIFNRHKKNHQSFNETEVQMLELLLKYGAHVRDCYDEPVTVAVEVGSYRAVQLLCEHIAKKDLKLHNQKNNPLKIAAENGRGDIIELLLRYQVNINGTHFSNSPLDVALWHGHFDCAKLLIKYGAAIDIKSALRSAVRNQLLVYLKFLFENFPIEVRGIVSTQFMNDLLISAAGGGNLEIIGLLIDAGANVNGVSSSHKSPLMKSSNVAVVHYLIQRGAIVNKCCRVKGHRYKINSVLTYILSCKRFRSDSTTREEIVQTLLEHGALKGKSCIGKASLIMAASQLGSCKILQMLLEHGANVNAIDNQGNTALLIAAEKNCIEYVNILLPYTKHIINVQNYKGLTALMIASKHNNLPIVKELVENGADVNIKDKCGNTALLLAQTRFSGQENEILLTLLNAGCDINYQNNSGKRITQLH